MDIITLVCCEDCGKDLHFNQDNHILFVRPCAGCSNDARNEGYEDGYNRREKNRRKSKR